MTSADDHNDDAALAGEYALHLLDADARRAFEDRMTTEPLLRVLVAEWDEELAALADEVPPVEPPAALKRRIQNTLFATPKRASGFSLWRMFAGAGAAAALGLAVLIAIPTTQPVDTFTPSFTAQLAAEDQSLIVLASFASETSVLRIDRQSGGAREGRVLELWLIAEGASAPVSLGVLPEATATDITLPPALADVIAGGTLAISDEPPGGSTTGAPTGDVLAAGAVIAI